MLTEQQKERIKLYQKKYRQEHKAELLEYNKNWQKEHPESVKLSKQRCFQAHKQEHYQYYNEYRRTHPEKAKERDRKRYTNNIETEKLRTKRFRESHKELYKEAYKKHWNKRKRELGFKPLNKSFGGSNAHHLDKKNVIYVPDELHKSVPHRQNNEESMKQINILAWNFMESGVY